jgi:putative PIN family toxin of toxin-antitoxin system
MSADPKIRAVFDCMVFLQGAARRDSPAGACLLLVESEMIELCISEAIISEIRDVFTRPRLRQRFPALTDVLIEGFLMALGKRSLMIPAVPCVFSYQRDPKDEPYINLAIAAGARYLVSRDNDVLDLAKPSDADGARLRHHAPRLQILDPLSFLVEMRLKIEAIGQP